MMKTDTQYLSAALRLSQRNLGLTTPNPCVGALVVDSAGRIVGQGVTAPGGRPHAETQALVQAGALARNATLYVTLEPCAHHGRTPPCTDAIIQSGIARVVSAISDPDARVSGTGFAKLRRADIDVTTGLLAQKARRLHAPHILAITEKRPFVLLKMAVAKDGKIGLLGGKQVAVSGNLAWHHTHMLRAQSNVILVGAGTALNDQPSLTCRLSGMGHRSPARYIMSGARIRHIGDLGFSDELDHTSYMSQLSILSERDPANALARIFADGHQSVLLEGGAALAASFLDAGLVDCIHLIRSPLTLGETAVSAPLAAMTDPSHFEPVGGLQPLGDDTLQIYWRRGF